jgi:hypothetical protein
MAGTSTAGAAVRRAHITGKVEYREGDGQTLTIPKGPIEVEETPLDVTLSWLDGDTLGSTAIPVSDFKRYVELRAIEFDTPA